MNTYTYTVEVSADSQAHADQVMAERINHDEEYDDPTLGYIVYTIGVVDSPTEVE